MDADGASSSSSVNAARKSDLTSTTEPCRKGGVGLSVVTFGRQVDQLDSKTYRSSTPTYLDSESQGPLINIAGGEFNRSTFNATAQTTIRHDVTIINHHHYHKRGKRSKKWKQRTSCSDEEGTSTMTSPKRGREEKRRNEESKRKKRKRCSSCREEGEILRLRQRITVDLSDRISEGSKIFKGIHRGRCDEVIAVKIITKYTQENQKEVENLKVASEHENVVTYFGSGFCKYRGKNAIYIAMELCELSTLEDRITHSPGSRRFWDKVSENYQVAKGLYHLHYTCNILHRDIKPQNILFNNACCKISDFGLSKRMQPGKSNTPQSMVDIGTNGWRAPETSDCEAKSTRYSDVFSLGLVFYYNLSDGDHPYGGKNTDSGSRQCYIRENRRRSLGKCEAMPDGRIFEDLISSMLRHEPRSRPTMEWVLKHPAFWDSTKKLKFYESVVHCEEFREEEQKVCRRGDKGKTCHQSSLKFVLDSKSGKHGDKVLRGDWIDALRFSKSECRAFSANGKLTEPDFFMKKATGRSSRSSFDGKSVFSAIKFIRNRYQHRFGDRGQQDFVMNHEQLWSFCSGRYPWLFIYVYRTVEHYLKDLNVKSPIREIFEEYF